MRKPNGRGPRDSSLALIPCAHHDVPADLVPALRDAPDDPKRLKPAAVAMHREGNLVGADILLRRAVALGDEEKDTLELLRTVEFVLEDAPFRLP